MLKWFILKAMNISYIECYTRTFIESVYFIILCIFEYVMYFLLLFFVF